MIIRHQMLVAALTCASIVVAVTGAVADRATGILSPEEIGRQLQPKSRGLPVTGTVPVQPNPTVAPVNAPSVPPVPGSREYSSQPVQPTASQPPPTRAAAPSVTLMITFEFGSAQLKPESIEQVRNLGIALNGKLKDETKLLIEGHTDRKGRAYNENCLATPIRWDYLVGDGVSADRLETAGKAFYEPGQSKKPLCSRESAGRRSQFRSLVTGSWALLATGSALARQQSSPISAAHREGHDAIRDITVARLQ
jgi:outer membrane protein OmpA-like peptidoglycan-associated protein